jgi:hypothetical protein
MSDTPIAPPPSPQVPSTPPPKAGVHPLVWVGVGCGALLFLGVVAVVAFGFFAASKVREHVQTRGGKTVIKTDQGEVTVDQASGEGSFQVQTKEGKLQVQTGGVKLPAWLPLYPGAQVKGGSTMDSPAEQTVMEMFTTADAPSKVVAFYEKALKDAGFTLQKISQGEEDSAGAVLNAADKAAGRMVNVIVMLEKGQTTAQLQIHTKKGNAPTPAEE